MPIIATLTPATATFMRPRPPTLIPLLPPRASSLLFLCALAAAAAVVATVHCVSLRRWRQREKGEGWAARLLNPLTNEVRKTVNEYHGVANNFWTLNVKIVEVL